MTQALPDVQAYQLLKFSKFSCIPRNRPQPLINRGSSIRWRGRIDLGVCWSARAHAFRYRTHKSVSFYAGDLGIAPARLNHACHEVLGRSAPGAINARLRLEAERGPVFIGVRKIALSLGFSTRPVSPASSPNTNLAPRRSSGSRRAAS